MRILRGNQTALLQLRTRNNTNIYALISRNNTNMYALISRNNTNMYALISRNNTNMYALISRNNTNMYALIVRKSTNMYALISLMKQQFVVTHTIRQTEIPALLDSWVANTPSFKILYPRNNCLLYFRKNMTCLNVGGLG